MNEWVDERIDACMCKWIGGCIDGWMDGGGMDGQPGEEMEVTCKPDLSKVRDLCVAVTIPPLFLLT